MFVYISLSVARTTYVLNDNYYCIIQVLLLLYDPGLDFSPRLRQNFSPDWRRARFAGTVKARSEIGSEVGVGPYRSVLLLAKSVRSSCARGTHGIVFRERAKNVPSLKDVILGVPGCAGVLFNFAGCVVGPRRFIRECHRQMRCVRSPPTHAFCLY